MTAPESHRSLEEEVLVSGTEDWVSIAEVIGAALDSGATNPDDLRDLSVGLIARLILKGLIVAGDIGDDGGHVPWNLSAPEAIARIVSEWTEREDPFVMPGEIAWLNTTPTGEAAGELIWQREQAMRTAVTEDRRDD